MADKEGQNEFAPGHAAAQDSAVVVCPAQHWGGARDPLHLGLGHSLRMSARLYLCSPFVAVDYGVSFRARRERASVSESLEGKTFRRSLDAASSFDLELLGRSVPFLTLSGMKGNWSLLTATECKPWRCPLTLPMERTAPRGALMACKQSIGTSFATKTKPGATP